MRIQSLVAEDYHLILGMPGTGKTFVTVLLLKMLIDRGDKVLLSSYTHSALDNILIRFLKTFPTYKNKVTRIAQNKMHVDEKVRSLFYEKKAFKSINDLKKNIEMNQIFAVTCLSASSHLLSNHFLYPYAFILAQNAS